MNKTGQQERHKRHPRNADVAIERGHELKNTSGLENRAVHKRNLSKSHTETGNRRRSSSRKQRAVQPVGPLAAVEAQKISASLDNEQLAILVRDGFATLRPKLEEWLPLAIELRSRFEMLRKSKSGATILGCRTWEQFCGEKLGYSDGHVRSLMRGANPTTKLYGNKEHPNETRLREAIAELGDLTDDEYFEKGLRAIHRVLNSLIGDESRFRRLALRIAAQLQEDFTVNNDDDSPEATSACGMSSTSTCTPSIQLDEANAKVAENSKTS